jgi:hypothetical protein
MDLLALNERLPCFLQVFQRHYQHSEAFTVLFLQMFVVHLMCLSYRQKVWIARALQPFDPLMDEYLMYQEISDPI